MDTFKFEDVFVGRTAESERVYITAQTRRRDGQFQTTDHRAIDGYLELSIMGLVVEPRRRIENASRAGQCVDALDDVTKPAKGLTLEDVAELARIWRRWHLNGMQALCIHQTPIYETSRGYRQLDLDAIGTCLEGYRAGSAWLVEELPQAVAETVKGIMERATGDRD
jgi:hypothetical protein